MTLGGKGIGGYHFSLQTIEKIRQGNLGKIQSQNAIELHRTKLSKKWLVITPDGLSLEITNLALFSRQNNLTYPTMVRCAQGKYKHHKNWQYFYILE